MYSLFCKFINDIQVIHSNFKDLKEAIIKQILTLFALQLFSSLCFAQLSSFDIGLSVSKNEDTRYDQEYEYTLERGSPIFHLTVGAKIKASPKLTLTPKLAYSWSLQTFLRNPVCQVSIAVLLRQQ